LPPRESLLEPDDLV